MTPPTLLELLAPAGGDDPASTAAHCGRRALAWILYPESMRHTSPMLNDIDTADLAAMNATLAAHFARQADIVEAVIAVCSALGLHGGEAVEVMALVEGGMTPAVAAASVKGR